MTNYDYNLFDESHDELFDEVFDEPCDELFDELCCERYEEIGDKLLYEVLKIALKNAALGLQPRTAFSRHRSRS